MTRSSPVPVPVPADRVPPLRWLAVGAVAVGIFTLVTAEQLPVGLLPQVTAALRVSDGTAGLLVAVPGIVAGIAALLVPVLARRLDRRALLVALMAVTAAAHAASALAPTFPVLLASRILVGVAIGGFWAIAGGLAVRLVPPHAVGRATAVVFAGVGGAAVLGVPAGTLLGELLGWRAAFAALGGLAVAVLAALLLLPRLPAAAPVRPAVLVQQLRRRTVTAGVIATGLLVTGHFAAYTFIGPVLQEVAGVDRAAIGPLLLGYGLAGLVGNAVTGTASARDLRRTLQVIAVALAATVALFPVLGTGPVGGAALLVLWGLVFGGVSVGLQSWMLAATPGGGPATEAATALYTAVFNLSIALGAVLGGLVVDRAALPAVLWLGAALVALALLATAAAPGRRS